MTMYLDRKKARKLVLEELAKRKTLEEARLILAGDEFWNSETIWSYGKWRRQRLFKCYDQSYWATPTLVFYYRNGTQKRVPCFYKGEEK